MDFLTNIITAISGLYAISYIIDSLIETPKDLKILKEGKKRHLAAYSNIDDTQPIKISKNISPEDIDKILKNLSYPKELEEIIIEFKDYIDKENLTACLQRLGSLQINYINIMNDIKKYLQNFTKNDGTYTPINNTIDIFGLFDKKNILSHEFLHMASTGENESTGFLTILNGVCIGNGLDEGYTELLNKRIFKAKKISYNYNVEIVQLLELLFDNHKEMEYAYFHNNIFILYQTFLQYGSKAEFFQIIQNLDNLIETDIPIYKKITATKTKLNLYKIIKRSNNNEKIKKAETLLNKDPLLKIIKHKQKRKELKHGHIK